MSAIAEPDKMTLINKAKIMKKIALLASSLGQKRYNRRLIMLITRL